LNFLYFFIFLIPLFILLYTLRIKKWKASLLAIVRMAIQLSFAGFYLTVLFQYDNYILNLLYFLFMVLVSSHSISSNANLRFLKSFPLVYLANLIPQVIMISFMHFFVLELTKIWEARYFIPLGGMLLGNSLNASIVALRTFFQLLEKNMPLYQYKLSLGASKNQALHDTFRESISTAIAPITGSMASMGLVSLPGMMTGQILGGSSPLIAIKYQVMIVLAIFCTILYSTLFSLFLFITFAFDPYFMPRKEFFKEE
ncbi:MAG: ABC transporter permease, partial [Leptospiraceae bacterium]|nr:ABC transporter permease [Leptospiraceae bacterium]